MKISVKVKANAKQQKIEAIADGSLKISLKSPPIDGKANLELISLLAKHFQVSKSQVMIKSDQNNKSKIVEILV
ncbi:MAG: DUF167 domain-containing protein [Woronichinia naegeliana WA131]|jgi:uncharacterized protein (TIGR00251 family)|uniref:UPF0235 protein KA717_03225 n=1 Tax=Woronichinia naegeliana WA131 TaxID=2824559 RepID=A0A977PWU5_9CYAN|nr:MAG: DUF167 domain-containing protein [Woronichinia naegeliana WA131]